MWRQLPGEQCQPEHDSQQLERRCNSAVNPAITNRYPKHADAGTLTDEWQQNQRSQDARRDQHCARQDMGCGNIDSSYCDARQNQEQGVPDDRCRQRKQCNDENDDQTCREQTCVPVPCRSIGNCSGRGRIHWRRPSCCNANSSPSGKRLDSGASNRSKAAIRRSFRQGLEKNLRMRRIDDG